MKEYSQGASPTRGIERPMFAATVVVLVLFTFADAWMIQNHPNSVLVRSPIPFCHWKPHQKQRQSFSGVGVWKKGLFAKQNDDDDDDDRPAGPTPATAVAAATANVATTTATSRNQFQQQRHSSYWAHLQPKLKERIQKEGQERAMANKKKREPETDKKRRQLMFMKERDREKKRAARIARPVPLDDWQQRLNLTDLMPGMNLTGTCISHTAFGAYIDVGSECDGLLHVTQMRLDEFVTHPRQITRPGESINVTIRSINPILKKLHLTLLPWDTVQEQLVTEQYARNRRKGQGRPGDDYNDDEEEDDRIAISDIQVDDELWGELKRVTDFGAYVEVGATVDGFLHFMDHPAFFLEGGNAPQQQRRHPTEFMHRGDRVRVWVSDVDLDQERIKLTAHRPSHLPGPRRFIN